VKELFGAAKGLAECYQLDQLAVPAMAKLLVADDF
jgi:hypothetical protein